MYLLRLLFFKEKSIWFIQNFGLTCMVFFFVNYLAVLVTFCLFSKTPIYHLDLKPVLSSAPSNTMWVPLLCTLYLFCMLCLLLVISIVWFCRNWTFSKLTVMSFNWPLLVPHIDDLTSLKSWLIDIYHWKYILKGINKNRYENAWSYSIT